MSAPTIDARKKLIVALDPPYFPGSGFTPDDLKTQTKAIIESLGDTVVFYKVGLRLFPIFQWALELLRTNGKEIFLDIKSMDIPETVEQTVKVAASFGGIRFVTVNHGPYTVRAAVEGLKSVRESDRPGILFVPLLTSLDENDLKDMLLYGDRQPKKVTRDVINEFIKTRAIAAVENGADGIVCSGQEVEMLRKALGDDVQLVVPGIRPTYLNVKGDDQKRIATPTLAIAAGANYLVVGRPIITAKDPLAAARAIVDEIDAALQSTAS